MKKITIQLSDEIVNDLETMRKASNDGIEGANDSTTLEEYIEIILTSYVKTQANFSHLRSQVEPIIDKIGDGLLNDDIIQDIFKTFQKGKEEKENNKKEDKKLKN